ncbi:hypothetical protein K8Q98_03240 [Candidatus Nomurabacteria bacterium]|nr:hypothetical protein [Candidatus Nomurabacteria bacterium]
MSVKLQAGHRIVFGITEDEKLIGTVFEKHGNGREVGKIEAPAEVNIGEGLVEFLEGLVAEDGLCVAGIHSNTFDILEAGSTVE